MSWRAVLPDCFLHAHVVACSSDNGGEQELESQRFGSSKVDVRRRLSQEQ